MTVSKKVNILGESRPVKDLIKLIEKVGPSKSNVLVVGESGTGKELVAKMLHELSPCKSNPFVPVNCGAIPENLIESELFGHKKGSFTGAVVEKEGLFETAMGGTLFLDEIGELPLNMQVKLLRAIQDRSIRKVGGTNDIKLDVRIIAATNRDLEVAVKNGTFREDLYYRLNVIMIRTPPLRERGTDIDLLAKVFAASVGAQQGRTNIELKPETYEALRAYSWPGNIRELENIIQRAVTLENGDLVGLSNFPDNIRRAGQKIEPKKLRLVTDTGEECLIELARTDSEILQAVDEFVKRIKKIETI